MNGVLEMERQQQTGYSFPSGLWWINKGQDLLDSFLLLLLVPSLLLAHWQYWLKWLEGHLAYKNQLQSSLIWELGSSCCNCRKESPA